MLLHALPIFHAHGLFVALHGALLHASPILFHARFDAAAVVGDLPAATVFMGVPTFYTRLLAEPGVRRRPLRPHAPVRQRLRSAARRARSRTSTSAPATPSWSATA